MDWYYRMGDTRCGPVEETGLRELIARGRIDRNTEVWSPSLAGWQRIGDVAALEPLAKSASGATTTVDADTDAARPWSRYFARYIDIALFSFVWGVAVYTILAMTDPGLAEGFVELEGPVVWIVTLAGLIPFEGVLLSSFGTTPGKWLFGFRVEASSGNKPSFEAAIRRSALAWWRGLALGVPLVSLATMIHAKDVLQTAGQTTWDRDTDLAVRHRTLRSGQYAAWLGIAALVLIVLL